MSVQVRYFTAPLKKNPQAGDERFLKGRGVWQIRQQKRCWQRWAYGAWEVSNGRPVWEWVDKGSDRDRTSAGWVAPL